MGHIELIPRRVAATRPGGYLNLAQFMERVVVSTIRRGSKCSPHLDHRRAAFLRRSEGPTRNWIVAHMIYLMRNVITFPTAVLDTMFDTDTAADIINSSVVRRCRWRRHYSKRRGSVYQVHLRRPPRIRRSVLLRTGRQRDALLLVTGRSRAEPYAVVCERRKAVFGTTPIAC